MAKFIKIKGYYLFFLKTPKERYINPNFIEKIEVSGDNPNHTYLTFDSTNIMVVEQPIEQVLNFLNDK
jgi:hypothetical protein